MQVADGRRHGFLGLAVLLAAYLTIHLLLLVFVDLQRPDAILVGDRAAGRLRAIRELVEFLGTAQLQSVLALYGNPGDYAFHALFWALGGPLGVVAAQVAAGALALAALVRLGRLVLGSTGAALLAGAFYLLLPGSLLHPHVLATEGFFAPLLIGHVALLGSALLGRSRGSGRLLAAGVLVGLAAAMRPVFILFPVVQAIVLAATRARPARQILGFVALALAIGLAWPAFHGVRLGSFGWGRTGHSLPANLYGRVARMASLRPVELPVEAVGRHQLGPGAFLRVVAGHPKVFARTVATDLPNLVANSGLNSFAGRYLELYPMPRSTMLFMETADRLGSPFAALREVATTRPVLFPVNVVSVLAWLGFGVASLVGLVLLFRREDLPAAIPWTLLALPAYVMATGFAALGVRWSLRSPMEFVMALAAAAAVSAGWQRIRGGAGSGARPAPRSRRPRT